MNYFSVVLLLFGIIFVSTMLNQVQRYHPHLMPSRKVLALTVTGLLISPQTLGIAQPPGFAGDIPAAQPNQSNQKPLPEVQPCQTYQQPLPPIGQPGVFGLRDGTLVKLKMKEKLSSRSAETNDLIELEVAEAVKVGDVVVIPEGAVAKGVVTEVKRGKMLGRRGKLGIAVSEVTMATGERVALRASKTSGGGMSAGGIAANIILTPLFFLLGGNNVLLEGGKALLGGSNVTYKAGTEVEAFINGNYALDLAKFTVTPVKD